MVIIRGKEYSPCRSFELLNLNMDLIDWSQPQIDIVSIISTSFSKTNSSTNGSQYRRSFARWGSCLLTTTMNIQHTAPLSAEGLKSARNSETTFPSYDTQKKNWKASEGRFRPKIKTAHFAVDNNDIHYGYLLVHMLNKERINEQTRTNTQCHIDSIHELEHVFVIIYAN